MPKSRPLVPDILALDEPIDHPLYDKFVQWFDRVWIKIPDEHKSHISKYLTEIPGRVCLCHIMDHPDGSIDAFGRCCWYDHVTMITFDAAFIDIADSWKLRCVIAHELAHCSNKGSGHWTDDKLKEEVYARQVAKSWGFEEPEYFGLDQLRANLDLWRRRNEGVFGRYGEVYYLPKITERPMPSP